MPKKTFFNLPETKRQHIEESAISEFSSKPFSYASINTIVASAGISKGSFYQYFLDKGDLYQHVHGIAQKRKLELITSMAPNSNDLDVFAYLRWLLQVEVIFELRQPQLARIGQCAFYDYDPATPEDPEGALIVGGSAYFNEFLTQGILNDDIATWVDTSMASFLLGTVYHRIAGYLIQRLGDSAQAIKDGSADIREDSLVQDLFDNLIDLFEAGIARDPQIRKDFYLK